MTKSVNNKKTGRPSGAPTRYPKIKWFCRMHGYSQQHVRLCLDGRREHGHKVQRLWSQFQEANGGAA